MADAPPGSPSIEAAKDALSSRSRIWFQRLRAQLRDRLFRDEASSAPTAGSEPSGHPRQIGRFKIIDRIGMGGMSLIYAAHDESLDRKVAVKLLRPERATTGTQGRARMVREAKALAKLSHPSVIQVYEVGTVGDEIFIAMEFVDGVTLRKWQGEQPWRAVLDAYLAAGDGLAAAHRAGIIHRDFKPDNVLVRNDGQVRVLDFGLARTGAEPVGEPADPAVPPSPSELLDASLTRTGALLGTPAYMAPEQLAGRTIDARSDQFAFCVSLHEALYGHRPFAGQDMTTLAHNVLQGVVEEAPRYSEVPPRLRKALLRGLEVDPDKRYADMQLLLRSLTTDPAAVARRVLLLAAAALLTIVAAMVWQSSRENRSREQAARTIQTEFDRAIVAAAEADTRDRAERSEAARWNDLVLASANARLERDPTVALAILRQLSPADPSAYGPARLLAAAALDGTVMRARVDAGVGPINTMVLSADERTVAIGGDTGVVLWHHLDAQLQRIEGPAIKVHDLDLDAEGRLLVAGYESGVARLWDLKTGAVQRLDGHAGPVHAVALSAKGRRAVTGGADGSIRLWDWGAQAGRTLRNHEGPIRSVDFSSDGTRLVTASDDMSVRLWFLDKRTHWKLEGHSGSVRHVAFDDDDYTVTSAGHDGRVVVWDVQSGKIQSASNHDVNAFATAKTAYAWVMADSSGNVALRTPGAREPTPVRLPFPATAVALGATARYAAVGDSDGRVSVWDARPYQPEVIGQPNTLYTAIEFAPHARWLAAGAEDGRVEVWDVDAGTLVASHEAPALGDVETVSFDPSGQALAVRFERAVAGWDPRSDAWWFVDDSDGGFEGPVRWSDDGRRIATGRCMGGTCELMVWSAAGDLVSEEPTTGPPTALRFTPSADGLLLDAREPDPATTLVRFDGTPSLGIQVGDRSGQHVAFAFVAPQSSLRMATVASDDTGAPRFEIWHVEPGDDPPYPVYGESSPGAVFPGPQPGQVVIQRSDGTAHLWDLTGPAHRSLPAFDGLPTGDVRWSSDGVFVVARTDATAADPIVMHVASGSRHVLPKLGHAVAVSTLGTVADAGMMAGIRYWVLPGPPRPREFRQWIGGITRRTAELGPGR